MNYDIKQSGAYIRALRIQPQYTQEESASTVNIDWSFLNRIESGQKGCFEDLLIRSSELLHVPLDTLICGGHIADHEALEMCDLWMMSSRRWSSV